MSASVVDRVHKEFAELLQVLDKMKEVSLHNTVDDNCRKLLLMAAASYFERRMTDTILNFSAEITTKDHVLTCLVKKKVVNRQYHSWFDWNVRNANRFFSLFGASFQQSMKEIVNGDNDLDSSIRAFMEIGRERNRLVHQDFGSFLLEKTSGEIYTLYRTALRFVEWFPDAIRDFCREQQGTILEAGVTPGQRC